MHFLKLRLTGFKSFVDPGELLIEPGLTGIVGPNGCGKSNLVEALRWVMGESRAKSLRGDGMDDVIFGGSGSRPARNIAEVTLLLDNDERTAPAPFTNAEQLEITRRIERGEGSDYRINGRSVRARDVQMLFADQASGAQSPAMVSQGRVGALINARPEDRRQLLEEAAGISGLHARRHEAELRLRAAESNLMRVEDVVRTMNGQLSGLQKQAKQANRYKILAEQIRRAEAMLLFLKQNAAESALAAAQAQHAFAEQTLQTRLAEAAQAERLREAAMQGLPGLRQAETAVGSALQALRHRRAEVAAELRRLIEAKAAQEHVLTQAANDLAREQALAGEATAAAVRLSDEAKRLTSEQTGEAGAAAQAASALAAAAAALETQEAAVTALTGQVAALDAERAARARALAELDQRTAALTPPPG